MFGYVKPVVPELLVKEHEFYRATYCGICRSMKKHTGRLSNAMLSYDSVFLALVRMAYIEDSELHTVQSRCIAHPMKKRCMLTDNSAVEYTARAFAILAYYKTQDDLGDEKIGKRMLLGASRPIARRARRLSLLPELERIVSDRLEKITALERAGETSVDAGATLFGELLGEVFAFGLSGGDRLVTYSVGYHLGRFIYAADAAEDYAEDVRLGRYNPYARLYGEGGLTEENKKSIKTALLLECRAIEGAVNLVPFGKKLTAENIVKNVIYLGLVKRIEFLDSGERKDK